MLLLMLACNGPGPTDTADPGLADCDAREFAPTDDQVAVIEGNTAFAADLYNAFGEGNTFFSPLSISAAFGMTSAGTAGNTQTELYDALHVDIEPAAWHAAFGGLLVELESDRGDCKTEVAIANRLFGQTGYAWQSDFLSLTSTDYQAPLEEWDFQADPEGGRQHVNGWVEDQTNGLIEDLLPPNSVDSGTRLVLANAIYFLGEWTTAFDEADTQSGTWRPTGEDVQLMTMDTVSLPMAWGEGFSALQMPYGDEELAMVIVLPDEAGALPTVDADLLLGLEFNDVELDFVQVPKFSFTQPTDLAGPMQQLGVIDAWIDGTADFSNLSDVDATGESLFISGAFHKAFIDVNEAGTEAAAATAVVVGTESAGPSFIADHPFVFFIQDTRTGQVLFLGRLVTPE